MTQNNFDRLKQTLSNWLSLKNVSLVEAAGIHELHLNSLEERVLYSAVPLPVDLVEYVDAGIDGGEAFDVFEAPEQSLDLISDGIEKYFGDQDSDDSVDLATSQLQSTEMGIGRVELVIVDQSVDGFQLLVDDILSHADGTTQYELAFLNPLGNGVEQISSILQKQSSDGNTLDSVHLVTHGSDGALNLGNTQLNTNNLSGFAHQVIGWQDALSSDADILIYGCNVTESAVGESFIQDLADLTGTDIAASDDTTGHDSLSGDWEFEFAVGAIESDVAFSVDIQASWMFDLGGEDVTSESGTATGRNLGLAADLTVVQVYSFDNMSGNGSDIYYQTSDGSGTNPPVLVNSSGLAGEQHWATVAVADDGDFVVVWTSDVGGGEEGVFGKVYSSDGSIIRDEFRIDPIGSGGNDASVAMDAGGNFIVAWEGDGVGDADGIYAQRFDTAGAEVASTFLVNDLTNAGLTQGNVDVAMNDSGQFVFAWDTFNSIFEESNIYARWFDSDGTASGSVDLLVDSDFLRFYLNPSVDINNSGNFVVVYGGDTDQDVKDGSLGALAASVANSIESGVFAKTYSVAGTTVTNEVGNITVNETTAGVQENASVVLLDDDTFIVGWQGEGTARNSADADEFDSQGVFKNTFNLFSNVSLQPNGAEFIDDSAIVGDQRSVAIAKNGSDFVFGFEDSASVLELETSFTYSASPNFEETLTQNNTVFLQEGSSIVLSNSDLLATDSDNSDNELVFTITSDPTNGVVLLSGSVTSNFTQDDINKGLVSYQHNSSETSADSAEITLDDGFGTSTTFTLNFSISPLNDDPLIVNNLGAAFEEGSLENVITSTALRSTDVDDAPDQLTYTIDETVVFGKMFNGAAQLSVGDTFTQQDLDDGAITYSHNGSDPAQDSFSFTVADGGEDGATPESQTFLIDINPVNEAPVLSHSQMVVDEGSAGNVISNSLLSAVDANDDANELTYTLQDVPSEGSLFLNGVELIAGQSFTQQDVNDGAVTYHHCGSESLSDSVSLSLADGLENGVLAEDFTFSISVNPVNDAPFAADDVLGIVSSGTSTKIPIGELLSNDSDAEGDAVTLASFSQPTNGTLVFDLDNNEFVYTPNAGFSGIDSFEYTVTDGSSNMSTGTASIEVNDPPVANDDSFEVVQDQSLNESVANNDVDVNGNDLSFAISSNVANGTLILDSDGSFSYVPEAGFFGADSFSYSVSDGFDVSEVATVFISVKAPPIVNDDSFSVTANASSNIQIFSNDFDPDGLLRDGTFVLINDPDEGVLLVGTSGNIVYQQTTDTNAIVDSFQYQIVDEDGLASEIATVTITINHQPQDISLDGNAVQENSVAGTVVGEVAASDLNDDIVSFSLEDDDGNSTNDRFSIDPANGQITVNNSALLDYESAQSHDVTVLVTDAVGLTTAKTFTIAIEPVNEAPVTNEIVRFVDEGGSIQGNVSDSTTDPESDRIRYHVSSEPVHGTVMMNKNGRWVYSHDNTENFVDEFSFEAVDAAGNVTTEAVKIIINPIDDIPVANPDSFATDAMTNVDLTRFELLQNDENVDSTAVVNVVSLPENGTLVQNSNGSFTFIPGLIAGGEDFFEYVVVVDGQVSNITRVTFDIDGMTESLPGPAVPPDVGQPIGGDVVQPEAENEETNDPGTEDESETDQTPQEETESTPEDPTDSTLQGPLESETSNPNVQAGTDPQKSDAPFGENFAQSTDSTEESTQERQRSLTWQPRYAVYGDQLFAEASLSVSGRGQSSQFERLGEFSRISIGLSDDFLTDLDNEQLALSLQFSDIPILSFSTSSLLTVGYLMWAFRAGALVSTFISMPALTQFDPLPVIEKGIPVNFAEDDDALEKLVDTV